MPPKKPAAALTAGLVAKKGSAAVSDGAPQRGATPTVAPVAPSADLVPMNFRVPGQFKEEFDSYAFNSKPRRKNVQLLKDAFQALKEKEGGQ